MGLAASARRARADCRHRLVACFRIEASNRCDRVRAAPRRAAPRRRVGRNRWRPIRRRTKGRVSRPNPLSPSISSTLPTRERLPVRVANSSTLLPDSSAGRVALPEPTVIAVSQPISAMKALACSPWRVVGVRFLAVFRSRHLVQHGHTIETVECRRVARARVHPSGQ